MLFQGADFDGVDFSQMNLSQTVFASSTVNDAVLTAKSMTYDFRGTPWWEAYIIDQAILPWVITYYFPYNPGMQLPGGYKITADEYRAKINRLCTEKMIACSENVYDLVKTSLRFLPRSARQLNNGCRFETVHEAGSRAFNRGGGPRCN